MANLKIVTDNAIARAMSLTSTNTAGTLVAANLQVDRKSSVWRATGTAARLTATWPDAEEIGAVTLPFCNLSPAATMRVRVSHEQAATNLIRGSESLSASHGWAGCSVIASAVRFAGTVSYVEVKKTSSSSGESRYAAFGSISAGSAVTATLALRAGANTAATVGLFDGSGWGAASASNAEILAGPGSLSQLNGSQFNVTGLSAATDTLVRITRTYAAAATGSLMIYPGTANSTNTTHSILATRIQVEAGTAASSYYPTTTAAATRPAGYIDGWQSYDYDSGWVEACPAPAIRLRGFTPAQAASAYAYGGGACARHWLPVAGLARGLAVDIDDPNNLQGYIEAACVVAGPVWSPRYNASAASVAVVDRTVLSRVAAGDQLADPGTINRRVPIDLRLLTDADRATLLSLMRNSRAYPILLSVFPGHADLTLERDFTVYGLRTKDSDIAYQYAGIYATTLEIEEI